VSRLLTLFAWDKAQGSLSAIDIHFSWPLRVSKYLEHLITGGHKNIKEILQESPVDPLVIEHFLSVLLL
jgi:hypothetical protein